MFFSRLCLSSLGLFLLMQTSPLDARSLSEAATRIARKLEAGVIVTAEKIGAEPATYAAAGRLEPADVKPEDVLFEIGSISKVFTGLLLAQATLESRVTLDTTLEQILDKEQTFADPRVGAITLKQLSTHTSGLPRLPDNLAAGSNSENPYAHYDRAALSAYLAKAKLAGESPYEMSYSNLGAGLLGDVLARIYGKTWEELVMEKIALPLGMRDTVVTLNEDQAKRFAPAYEGTSKRHPWTFQALAGAGALRSTAADMLTFGDAILHPEKTPFPDAIHLMKKAQTSDGTIGLGIMMEKFLGHPTYEHDGGTGGFQTHLQVIPENKIVRVVLCNNAAIAASSVLVATFPKPPTPLASDKKLSKEDLAVYEGTYLIGESTLITILQREGQLWAQLTGQIFAPVFLHQKADRFFFKTVSAELQFNREQGKIASLILIQNGREQKARKTSDVAPQITFRTSEELAEFTGTYVLAPMAFFTLKVEHNTLFAQLTGQTFLPVFEKQTDKFEYDVVKATLEFERDKDRQIVALKLHQNGQIMRAVKAQQSK